MAGDPLIGVDERLRLVGGLAVSDDICGFMSIEVDALEVKLDSGNGTFVNPGIGTGGIVIGVPANPVMDTGGVLDRPGMETGVAVDRRFDDTGVLVMVAAKLVAAGAVDDDMRVGMCVDTRLYRPVTGSWTSCATGDVPDPPGIVMFGVPGNIGKLALLMFVGFVALFTVKVLVPLTFAVLSKICGAKDVFAID